jgi:hypothetical protein
MNKNFDQLEVGDVIWAEESDIGKHIYILCGDKTNEKIDCISAVTISKSCEQCVECCIEVKSVPSDWFKHKEPVSYIRLEKPRCINASNYQPKFYSFKGNLSDYPEFYKEVCQKSHNLINPACGCE